MSAGSVTSDAAQSASTSSFITSLTVNTAIAGGELVAFVIFRRWIKAIYEPRTYIPEKKLQAPVLGKSLFMPLWRIITADPEEILKKNGVDPYVFVRFLIMMAKAMIPIWILSWIVLLPINAAHSTVDGKTGLDRFTFGNVAKDKQSRYWAHLVLDYVFVLWILYLIWGEMRHWLIIRQKHLINPAHSRLPQASTVLVTGIPTNYMDEDKLAQLYSRLPGGVKRIWLARNLKEMPDLLSRRQQAEKNLEAAQVKLIKLAQQHKQSKEDKVAKLEEKQKPVPDTLTGPNNPELIQHPSRVGIEEDPPIDPALLGRADQLVPRSLRPTKRLKPKWAPFGLGFLGIGEKVDTIDWARNEIKETTEGLTRGRAALQRDLDNPGTEGETYPPLNAAFIHFNQQIAAHMAAQSLAHNLPYRMNQRYIEQSPENVIWRNLSLNSYEQTVRKALSWAATFGLLIAWSFPVAFVGALSNVTTLTEKYHWLAWLGGDSTAKSILQGVVSGLLPPILLAVLMLLLPIVLRQIATFEGIPSKTEVELDLMTRYFIFLVWHTFFVVSLTSGLVSAVQQLANDPASIAQVLASQMPTASTFFITLILTQFTGTAGTLLQAFSLVIYYIKVVLFGATPRSVYNSRYHLRDESWGKTFPGITVYAVIMLAYCVISPIINGFGACFFLLSALVFKYLFIWVEDQPPASDTGGIFFPKAITHVFVGLYIQEVCLCALFFLSRNDQLKASAIPQGALMVVLIVITASCHYLIITSYSPLVHSLPLSLAHLSYGMPAEKGHEGSQLGSEDGGDSSPLKTTVNGITPQASPNSANTATEPSSPHAVTTKPGPPQGRTTPTAPPSFHDDSSQLELNPMTPPAATQGVDPESHEPDPAEVEEPYFALPGGPGIVSRRDAVHDDPNAFFHPATKEPPKVIWLPRDHLGLAAAEIEKNADFGIESSYRMAWLTDEGKVRIGGPPPGEGVQIS